MGACDSAAKKVNTYSRALRSSKRAINSVKKLINNKVKYTEVTSSAFDKYDKDKSGYIEQSELKAVIKDMAAKLNQETEISEEDVINVLQTIDTNRDGKISKEEFANLSREKLLEALS